MARQDDALIGPVGARLRIQELDVLRGIALFGVLAMNFIAFTGDMVTTEAQKASFATAALDEWTYWGVRWLIGDKANTVFATLFGLGFYLQLQRGEGRPGFEARYARRLFWLLVFGVLNVLFLWVWDILHLYALAGFFLLAMRRWKTRSLVAVGAAAAFYSDKVQSWLIATFDLGLPSSDHLFAAAAVARRQAVAISGDYPAVVADNWQFTLVDWLMAGTLIAYLIYALGRFALGAAIGRSGILEEIPRFVPLLRRIAWVAIPAGLVFSLAVRLMTTGALGDNYGLRTLGPMLRSPAALLLAAGYCAAVVVALQKPWGRQLFGIFAPVGQMALTNYLAQGLLIGFVLYGVGPGLGLAGRIGSFAVLLTSIAFFAFQVAYSHWWLARFRFGPMEWLWRTLTYGERPPFLQSRSTSIAA